ncbi:MAG: shikimate dehydrogenase [Hyphomicrobiaceae bacterium]|nr:shikimate dehydrogenase [Hyphomicrobiaceae bacterium]
MTRAFVIGHPIAHSRSPLIHRYWLEQLQITGQYDPYDIPPEALADFVGRIRTGEFAGGNVTIPLKERVTELCDELTPTAAAIGAVNTLFVLDGQLIGDNTDAYGFLANLDDKAPGWDQNLTSATILGAGGASRALIFALMNRTSAPINLVNRTRERAETLADAFGPSVRPTGQEELPDLLAHTGLLINATSLGMHDERHDQLDLSRLPKSAVVTDIVYVPLQTPLLDDAAKRGLKTVDGLGMLLHQAVPGFEYWFGVRPEVDNSLRQRIEADLFARDKA